MFAAAIIIITGLFSVVEGLAGIFRDESYFLANGQVLVFDYTAWGWIHLILGIAMIAIGFGLYSGSTLARVLAIVVVGLDLVAQFAWIGAHPWWSVIVIALNVVIIYALIVHGGELKTPA
jgi:hypothetical protein